MIRLYPEQLRAQLNEGAARGVSLLGNDPLLLQESRDAVRQVAAAQGFEEHHTFSIDPNTDWNAIFSLCRAMSLLQVDKRYCCCYQKTDRMRRSMSNFSHSPDFCMTTCC